MKFTVLSERELMTLRDDLLETILREPVGSHIAADFRARLEIVECALGLWEIVRERNREQENRA